ncbi:phage tail protein [Parabacteroides distasonis]|uniref:Phage tail protein n=1 Tax=Parabacteroides distasonis TaxID=823 RepID=A0A7K0GN86_PARDI|nr:MULTISPECIES: phage tail sheath protein [Bacteria]MRY60502.1 phage tail protein [Parabacteroides distasonis]MTU02571.1 phage tail protein [Parasutterella excrementihominis]MTU24690.1 phage tail protein [Parasutterella excrementihominis]
MAEQYLHGAEVVEIDNGARPIRTAQSGVIGLVGTAPDADATAFPLNTPVLIAGSRREAVKLGAGGTLPQAIDGIFDQTGAVVVVIRVDEGVDSAATQSNVIGKVDADTEQYTGILALLSAENTVKVQPRILIAPGFSNEKAVADQLVSVADKLRGYVILDGPNTTDAAAITYRELFGSRRCEVVDPWYKVWDVETSAHIIQPPSARHAGVMAKVHNTLGFWWSNSNQEILGIDGLCRPVDFKLDDPTCRANLLNAKEVTTTIQQNGFRVWGDRTCSADSKWAFKNVVITNDMIADSLVRNHLWAVDRNITKTYVEDVTEGVNNYLRHLKNIGAIAGGECWVDPELNSPDQIQQGKVYFDYDFSAYAPAEHITFRSHMVNGYLTEVV